MLKVEAFCDASHSMRTKRAVACSIILSELMFHGIETQVYTNVTTGAQAELLGIIQTMKFIRTLEGVTDVTIYCDSESMIDLYSRILETRVLTDELNYRDEWLELMALSEGLNITPAYIQGHSMEHSCNKVCDLVAHSVLKWENT